MTSLLVGGVFALEAEPFEGARATTPRFLDPRNQYFCNATSALAELLGRLTPGSVWLPSYCCIALFLAAEAARVPIRIYGIGGDLSWDETDWIDQVRPGDAVVIIDYFGRRQKPAQLEALRARGAWVIEDATQAMLNDQVGEAADFTIFSPRKFLGVPDGGILASSAALQIEPFALEAAPAEWWLTAFNATLGRRDFDRFGGERRWFDLFQQAERTAPIGPFAMSGLSRVLLSTCFDYAALRKRRQDNYDRLEEALGDLAVMPPRDEGEVPMAFPIRVMERSAVLKSLFSQQIFSPVHWPLEGFIPHDFADSHRLSREIISLHCDHRYGEADMRRIVEAVRAGLR